MAISYPEFKALAAYRARYAGAAMKVTIVNEEDPSDVLIGAIGGINPNDNFEAVPIEEMGNDGTDEIVQGRHDGGVSIPGSWSPAFADVAPSRRAFIGKVYTVYISVSPLKQDAGPVPGADVILDVFTSCTVTNLSTPAGARGVRTFSMSFLYTDHLTGQQWADLAGSTS